VEVPRSLGQPAGTSPKDDKFTVKSVIKNVDGSCTVREFDFPEPEPRPASLPPQPTPFDDYYDNDVTRRTARDVPRLLQMARRVSGLGRAREEIFLRRAQLASEMNSLGMPPILDWKPGARIPQHDGEFRFKSRTKIWRDVESLPQSQRPLKCRPLEGKSCHW
jgi:hypothetical protein